MKFDRSKYHITNGIIRKASVGFDRDIFLSCWVFIEHEGGGTQGFGGWILGATPDAAAGNHASQPNLAGEWIVSVLRAADVESFSDVVGKSIRVVRATSGWNETILGIGHIIKDDRWFMAKERMESMLAARSK